MSRTISRAVALATSFTAFTASTALADSESIDLTAQDLAAMDRATGATGAGVDLTFTMPIDEMDFNGFASRVDLHGRYVHDSGFGGYAAIGVSKTFLSSDDPLADEFANMFNEETGVTALEVGGLYRRELNQDFSLVAHAGVSLPTASDGVAAIANIMTQQHRITDMVTAMPETTALRIGVTPLFRRGIVFARADLGADIVVDQPSSTDPMSFGEMDPLVHANLAVGVKLGKLSTSLQLQNVATTGDVDENEDRFLHSATIEARYDLGRVAPSLAITSPLDDSGRGDSIAVTGSVGFKF